MMWDDGKLEMKKTAQGDQRLYSHRTPSHAKQETWLHVRDQKERSTACARRHVEKLDSWFASNFRPGRLLLVDLT